MMEVLKPLHHRFAALAAACWLTSSMASAEKPSDYDRALAAGYKAQFTCSGLWNGGKSQMDIEADELTGIYDRVADILPDLPMTVDADNRQVQVRYDTNSPPRTAMWNPKTGCTAMPIWFDSPKPAAPPIKRAVFDNRTWPMGDVGAMAPLSAIPNKLSKVVSAAQSGEEYGGKTSAVLVIRNGRILAETFKNGHDKHTGQRTWSVAKSIAGTLVGHAVQKNGLDVYAAGLIPQWADSTDPRRQITPDQLMRMASGLTSDTAGNRTDPIYLGGASVIERTTSWPLFHKPGSRFRYANNDTLLAVQAAGLDSNLPFKFL